MLKVASEKFLEYIVTQRGINPHQISAIPDMCQGGTGAEWMPHSSEQTPHSSEQIPQPIHEQM